MPVPFECGNELSVESHRTMPAPFLTKTFQLVDDQGSDDIVSWGEDGSTFVVWKPPEFATDLLPNYFKHNNFSSFVRQLNTYGFRKVVPDRWEFANEYFRRGEKQLLSEIHRRKTPPMIPNGLQLGSSWSCDEPWSMPILPYIATTTNSSLVMSEESERLRRENLLLSNEVMRLQRLYEQAMSFLQQYTNLPSAVYHYDGVVDDSKRSDNIKLISSSFCNAASTMMISSSSQMHPAAERPHSSTSGCTEESLSGPSNSPTANCSLAKASTMAFLDARLRELAAETSLAAAAARNDEDDEDPTGPKLFGVSLKARKRSHSREDDQSVRRRAS